MSDVNVLKDSEKKLENLINSSNPNGIVDKIINDMSQNEIYIIGIGNAGTMTYNLLKNMDLKINGFFDKRYETVEKYMGKKVISINNDLDKESILVIIAYICSYEQLEETKINLRRLGYKNIIYYHEIYNLTIKLDYIQDNKEEILNDSGIFKSREKSILEIETYLGDNRSRCVYYDYYNAIINSNPNLFSLPDKDEQYFPNDIVFSKGYKRFVDCGAYDGDTAITLNRLKGNIEKIALFEPDLNNFKRLGKNLENNNIADQEILYPCGVWNKTEMLSFKAGFECSSSLSENGEIFVQCVALDDVLKSFQPTFIKMDIEGSEYNALLGAKNLIKKFKPDLAISVYHKLDDLITIPTLIKELNPNYEFYLRTYEVYGMETILYAVDKPPKCKE